MNKNYGRSHIAASFQKAKQSQIAALMPYFTLGYPDRATSLAVIEAIAPHCDMLELGVPFSDPIADGPTVQHSTQKSLEQGTTTADCLQMVRELRQRGVDNPFLLMGYYNPVMAYGIADYVREAAAVGADGFIVPDLTPEEAGELEAAAHDSGLALIHFLAPTSNPQRIEAIAKRAQGFIYLVSVAGVTGARKQVQGNLGDFVGRVRQLAKVPLAVGFGISTPQQAAAVGQVADGVIVGSALINAVEAAEDKPQAAMAFTQSLQMALQK